MSSDYKEETREVSSDPDEETREASSNAEKETQEALSDPEEETKDVAGLAVGSTDLEGLIVPARRKLTMSGNLPPNTIITRVESTGDRRQGRTSTAKYSADNRRFRRERRQGEYFDMRRRGLDDFAEKGGGIGADSEGHVIGVVNWQQAMNALEMEERRKVRRKKKCRVARPNDKLVVGARVICKRKVKDGEVENYGCRLIA